jgi:hypothetical protein
LSLPFVVSDIVDKTFMETYVELTGGSPTLAVDAAIYSDRIRGTTEVLKRVVDLRFQI